DCGKKQHECSRTAASASTADNCRIDPSWQASESLRKMQTRANGARCSAAASYATRFVWIVSDEKNGADDLRSLGLKGSETARGTPSAKSNATMSSAQSE